MAKPLTPEQIAEFRKWCRECFEDEDEDDEAPRFFSFDCPVTYETDDEGDSIFEYHDINGGPDGEKDRTHDIYELFASVSDEFEFEENGQDEFFINKL